MIFFDQLFWSVHKETYIFVIVNRLNFFLFQKSSPKWGYELPACNISHIGDWQGRTKGGGAGGDPPQRILVKRYNLQFSGQALISTAELTFSKGLKTWSVLESYLRVYFTGLRIRIREDPGFFQLLDPDPDPRTNPGSGSRSHKFVRNCSFSSKILTNSKVKTGLRIRSGRIRFFQLLDPQLWSEHWTKLFKL